MKKIITMFFVMGVIYANFAQVAINTDGSAPDTSAMLDVKSTAGGILIPRMSAADRDAITSPATGLLVFVTDDHTFYYFDGANWVTMATDNDWTVNGNDMYNNNTGNVGIGTNTPSEKLEVNGDIKHGNALKIYSNSSGGTHTWVSFNSPDNGYGDNIFLGAGGTTVVTSGEAANTIKANIDTTNGHETFYIGSDNNFRLYNNLQNGWDSRIEALLIDKDRDWHIDMKRIYIHDSIETNHRIPFISRTDYHYGYGIAMYGGQGFVIGGGESPNLVNNNIDLKNTEILYLTSDQKDNAQAIKFITNTQDGWDQKVEAMTILGNGKVGIGLNNPTGMLHIAHKNDAGPNGAGDPGADFVIGDVNGQHLEIDDNEIHAMSDANNGSVLYLNDNGELVEFGATIRLKPSDPPSNPDDGTIYFDNNSKKLRCYSNGSWHDLW